MGAESADLAPRPPVALYVHIPFCLSVCPYCDFVVYAGSSARGPRNRVGAFLRALRREIELRAQHARDVFGPGRPALDSVYLGGGTPSLLSAAQLAELLDSIASTFGLNRAAEITLEANPGPADLGDLRAFLIAGVTRLSVGAQSMQDAELRGLGRRHSAADVRGAVFAARRAGLENIGLDLLYDIPGQTPASWDDTIQKALRLEVQHVSAYALTLSDGEAGDRPDRPGDRPDRPGDRPGDRPDAPAGPPDDRLLASRGARRWRTRARAQQDDDRAADMYTLADERLRAQGLAWYEISNWARPGRESRHNLVYWTGGAYEAVGPGAHAFDGGRTRRWNAAHLESYIEALAPRDREPRLPPGASELLSVETARAERAMLGLRLARGLDLAAAASPSLRPTLEWARLNGLVEDAGESVRLSLRGRLLGNSVFERLV